MTIYLHRRTQYIDAMHRTASSFLPAAAAFYQGKVFSHARLENNEKHGSRLFPFVADAFKVALKFDLEFYSSDDGFFFYFALDWVEMKNVCAF